MYDHILMFNSEQEAKALFEYCIYPVLSENEWNTSIVIPGQKIVLARATYNVENEENIIEITPEIIVPGFFMTISLDHESEYIRELPNNVCRIIAHRDTGKMVYLAPDLNIELLSKAIIEPVPAGSNYLMGNL